MKFKKIIILFLIITLGFTHQVEGKSTNTSNSVDSYVKSIKNSGIYSNYIYEPNVYKEDKKIKFTPALIYSIYDDLSNKNPGYITKNILGTDSAGNKVYSYSLKPQSTTNNSNFKFDRIKILLTNCIHGYEQGTSYSTAMFVKDICENWEKDEFLNFLRWNVEFEIIPIVNVWGFENNSRTNFNKIDINRNINAEWKYYDSDLEYFSGKAPTSESESKILQEFIDRNIDADILIDYHNIGKGYPFVMLYSEEKINTFDFTFSKLTRYWRDKYPKSNKFESMGSVENGNNATIGKYATGKGIFSFVLETPWVMPFANYKYDKITLQCGTQILGNLIYNIFYK